jgi:hypothetical protein
MKGEGLAARSVRVIRGTTQLTIPLGQAITVDETRTAPVSFIWRNSQGTETVRIPRVTPAGLQIEGGPEEDLPDFFFFAANQTISSGENAERFSELRRSGRARQFVELFTKEYSWITSLDIEVLAGAPVTGAPGQ